MMKMRPSRVLQKLREGEIASCFKLNLESARVAEIAAMSGFDCIWTDLEHTSNDWIHIENQVRAAKCHNADTMVRVSRGQYSNYIKPLELDASGIMVPHVMSLEDAREIVRMVRFHPVGRRAVDGGNADGGYCGIDFQSYLQQANAGRFVVLQIEDPEPLEELDEIAALDGIDMLFFGPGDFSHAIGAPGDWNHPELLRARRAVADACRAHGKWAGTVANAANYDELVETGYRFLSCGADVAGLTEYCSATFSVFSSAPRKSPTLYGNDLGTPVPLISNGHELSRNGHGRNGHQQDL
jgi:4-hydroxy-2-oxoheptanedioate aldolase